MADSSPESETMKVRQRRLRDTGVVVLVGIALAAAGPGGPPTPPVLPPERTRLVRRRVLGSIAVPLPPRRRRRIRLLWEPREIAAAPTRRTANPVLPTVGRPRDGPHRRRRSPARRRGGCPVGSRG